LGGKVLVGPSKEGTTTPSGLWDPPWQSIDGSVKALPFFHAGNGRSLPHFEAIIAT